MPNGLLMLRHCFLDFGVEHWFGCRATEPGFAGDIGTIEGWLIDWLIVRVQQRGHWDSTTRRPLTALLVCHLTTVHSNLTDNYCHESIPATHHNPLIVLQKQRLEALWWLTDRSKTPLDDDCDVGLSIINSFISAGSTVPKNLPTCR